MIKNDRDRRTCDKYSARDKTGHVHCAECPNRVLVDGYPEVGACKATYHYDRHLKEWVLDEMSND